jgi:hypothetical protein
MDQEDIGVRTGRKDSVIVCPFCEATCPLMGDEERPFPFEGYGDFEAYRCPCGAVGSPSGDVGEAGWPLEDVEGAVAALLSTVRGTMRVTINYVTNTEPPMLMFWGKARSGSPVT